MRYEKDAHLLSGAYVLHATTDHESADVEAAMLRSEDLRSEVAELTDTAVVLGLSVVPGEPSAELRARVLAAVAVTPQLAPPERAVEEPGEEAPVVAASVVRGPSHWFRRSVMIAASVAAAVALVFGAGVVVDQAVQPRAPAAVSFARLTSAADVQKVSAAVTGGGTATVYSSARLEESAVVLAGHAAPSGKALQLWRVTGGETRSAGLYRPADGESYQMLDGSLRSGERLAVTVEPEGGSAHPTTRPIATAVVT